MAFNLYTTKPFFEPVLTYWQKQTYFNDISAEHIAEYIHSKKCIMKCVLIVSISIRASMSYKQVVVAMKWYEACTHHVQISLVAKWQKSKRIATPLLTHQMPWDVVGPFEWDHLIHKVDREWPKKLGKKHVWFFSNHSTCRLGHLQAEWW